MTCLALVCDGMVPSSLLMKAEWQQDQLKPHWAPLQKMADAREPLWLTARASDIKMHFLLAGGSSSSSEELSIVRSITSIFFLFASLDIVIEQGLLKTLVPGGGSTGRKKKYQR